MSTSSPSGTVPNARQSRVRSIQYLRAVAALSVVAYHASKRVDEVFSETVIGIFHLGHGGVDLFFVISGFIMWSIGCDAPRAPGQFLLRRAIRVIPPYWVATLCWVALMLVLGVGWIVITPAHVIQSLLFVPHWSPTFPDTFWPVLVPGWTLLFEMFFYALFALTLLVTHQWRLIALAAALLSLVGLGWLMSPETAAMQAYTSPLLLEFLAGCLIAEVWRRGVSGLWTGVALIIAGLLALVFLTPLAVPDQTSWGRPLTFGLAGALIVWGGVCLERYLPDMPLLERLGDASYAIYLFHFFVIQIFAAFWNRLPLVDNIAGAGGFVILCLTASSVLGLWLFNSMERPLQKRLTAGLTRRPGKVQTGQ
ncbi:acyltransferase [uncultured Tateyamaria sp.]|uniref:acyltransferase family protein n=1 Tax=Tateyamaria sp. 1078 TaxID=3417464 RepID=UPI00262CA7F5|nr:acyltransferase [uncultured Tateyamaria sp.]